MDRSCSFRIIPKSFKQLRYFPRIIRNITTSDLTCFRYLRISISGASVAPGESVTLPVWVLDGDMAFAPLVKFALTAPLSKSIVILCASMQEPGAILPSLNNWTKMLGDQIENIFDKATVADARKSRKPFYNIHPYLSRLCLILAYYHFIYFVILNYQR